MEEKLDLKAFYEATQPTSKNLKILFDDIFVHEKESTKEGFLDAANRAFAMLAHLKAYTFDIAETSRIKSLYSLSDFTKLQGILLKLQIAKKHSSPLDFAFNPSAVPMIQRYIKIFEAYEQQNGIKNPYIIEE